MIRDISTSIQIFDEPRLLGAVTRQLFDFQSGTATLSVVLSMAAPLRTLAVSPLTAPTGISIAPLGIADNALCADNRTLTCQQTYNFELDPQELCQLDGDYALQFSVGCHPSIVGTPFCPATMTQAPLSITVTLDSEDFCTIVQGKLILTFLKIIIICRNIYLTFSFLFLFHKFIQVFFLLMVQSLLMANLMLLRLLLVL